MAFAKIFGIMTSMKAAPILLFTAIITALSTAPVAAQGPASAPMPQQRFEVLTPDPPKPKTQTFSLSILDQGISDISRSIMMRLAYRQLFPTDASHQQGYVLSAHFHHLFATHPALLNRFVQASNAGIYPNYNEIGVGIGYRWAYENFALIPQAHFRDMLALGANVNQHLIGFEPGLRLEYWIYPEVARLSVDYGFNVPFAHLANQTSNVSPFNLSLHRIYTELSYRFLEHLDLTAGFYWWQVPAQLGSGSIVDTTLTNVTGFQVGASLTF
ncbi:MAG: hypothetical protein CVV27_20885 [Candidatus Melainabacteria bacterium HGW-Melainabacteria-1]|nr:MAG: hypothetical protein CVV27_20885 [Candidatus Melainabacteria bacterium HGW-Melainabacteria-1]